MNIAASRGATGVVKAHARGLSLAFLAGKHLYNRADVFVSQHDDRLCALEAFEGNLFWENGKEMLPAGNKIIEPRDVEKAGIGSGSGTE